MANGMTLNWNDKNVNIIKYGDNDFFLNVVNGITEVASYANITRDDVIVDLERRGLIKAIRGTAAFSQLVQLLGWRF
jgi:hypothetical protein